MLNVAYIVSTLKRCGPNSQLRSVIRHLDRAAFEPRVITLSPEPVDSVKALFGQDGVKVVSLNLSRVAGLFAARRRLRRLLRAQKTDLLHTQGIRADSLAASLRSEWPAVCSVRNFPQLDYPMTYGVMRGRWMAHSHARALRRVAAPVGVSEAVSRNLADAFGIAARTIRNGVETELWNPAVPEERSRLRKQFGFEDDTAVWVSVGHLSERKDPLRLIRAFKQAAPAKTKLVFLGSGPLEAACRREAAGEEGIVFAGRVENVSEYLQAADGFVSASRAEGFPNAALEALACGLPCVLTDIPPHQEIADSCAGHAFRIRERGGDTGSPGTEKPVLQDSLGCIRLFKEDASADIFQCLEKTELLCAQARAAAENVFSAAAMSAQYQAVYRELLSQDFLGHGCLVW